MYTKGDIDVIFKLHYFLLTYHNPR